MTTTNDKKPEKSSVISDESNQAYGLSSFLWPTVIQRYFSDLGVGLTIIKLLSFLHIRKYMIDWCLQIQNRITNSCLKQQLIMMNGPKQH